VSNSIFDNLERAIVLRGGAGLWEHRNAPDNWSVKVDPSNAFTGPGETVVVE
jgi:hypothetical protein